MADGNGMVNVEVVDEDGAIIVPGVAGGLHTARGLVVGP